jgi:hypothetical protein
MTTFTISNDSTDFGTFEGETPAHALAAMHRAAGYASQVIDGVVVSTASAVDADGVNLCPGIDDVTIAEVETEATYSVTFRGAATVDAYSATEGADDNDALTLTETRERCEAYGVSAELRDYAGFVKGFVSADGSYTLA